LSLFLYKLKEPPNKSKVGACEAGYLFRASFSLSLILDKLKFVGHSNGARQTPRFLEWLDDFRLNTQMLLVYISDSP